MRAQLSGGIEARPLDACSTVLRACGAIDRGRALELQRAIGSAVRGGRLRAIVDLSDAGDIEPGVVAALLHARRRLLAIGGELTVVAAGAPFGASSPLPVVESIEAARTLPAFGATRRAILEVVAPLRRALTRWSVDAGASQRTQEAVALAGSEAITNAVVHAYRDAPTPGTVSVSGELVEREHLHIAVSDQGSGMQPRPDSPGLGLGLPLISQLAESVEIDTAPGRGTRIAMDFARLSG